MDVLKFRQILSACCPEFPCLIGGGGGRNRAAGFFNTGSAFREAPIQEFHTCSAFIA